MMTTKTPRGIRCSNPLNIRHSANKWQGLADVQLDPDFCTFRAMRWGLRAAFIILRTYIVKYHLTTISSIVSRWAPRSENDTDRYIAAVAHKSGIAQDELIDVKQKNRMCRLVSAMCEVECGQLVSFGLIETAYHLAYSPYLNGKK